MTKNNTEQPLSGQVWIRLTPAERQRLIEIAEEEERSLSDTIRRGLVQHFKLRETEKTPMK